MTEGDLNFLTEELTRYVEGGFSVYEIYSYMKTRGSSMAYKNVHQKVHKLLSLGLIEEIGTGYVLHGAKYYQLSLNGWVNLILNSEYSSFQAALKQYYDKNIIFKTFIYPYFELETILFFLNVLELNTYLRNCCQTTIQTMNLWESGDKKKHGILVLPRDKLRQLPDDELLDALKYKLDVRSAYRDVHYTLDGLRKMIKSKGLAGLSVLIPKSITEVLDLHLKSFLFEQIMRASHLSYLRSALAEDRKFMAAIKEMGGEFNKSYDKLIDLGKMNK
jgi:hypothetical protein